VGARVALLPLLPDFTCPYCARGEFSLCDRYSFFGSRQDGGLAEYLVVPATNVLPLPDEVDDESAAMLEPLSVATKACLLAGLSPRPSRNGRGAGVCAGGVGPSALIMGAGAIGLLAVQVALALGASPVIACDVIPEKLALAASLGAETVLLPSPSATSDYRLPTTDFCLECSGHHAAFSPALDSLAKGGTLVLVGTGPGEVTLSGAQREQLCRRMITIRGQWMSYGPTWPGEPWTVPLALLAAGRLDPRRLITHRFPLAQTPEAVRFMLTPGADYLKVMVTDT
jgi:threonine dehydrogenase-like Zn-dependent dehydrogenase